MNRRDFLNITAGGVVAASLPLPALSQRAAATTAPRLLHIWALAMARVGNPISHRTLSQALKVTPAQAGALIGDLRASGVIGAPDAAGVARAIRRVPAPAPAPVRNPVSIQAEMRRLARHVDPLKAPENRAPVSPSTDDPAPPEASDAARSTG